MDDNKLDNEARVAILLEHKLDLKGRVIELYGSIGEEIKPTIFNVRCQSLSA